MSTKSTITFGPTFHLYHDLAEEACVYLRVEKTEFETTNDCVTIRIPTEIWEHLRKFETFTPQWAGKSDQEILEEITSAVDERIRKYSEADQRVKDFIAFCGSGCYGLASDPRDQQITSGVEWATRKRTYEIQILEKIRKLSESPQ